MITLILTTAPPASRPPVLPLMEIDLVQWNASQASHWSERVAPLTDTIHLLLSAEVAFGDSHLHTGRVVWISDVLRNFREDVANEIKAQLLTRSPRPYRVETSFQL